MTEPSTEETSVPLFERGADGNRRHSDNEVEATHNDSQEARITREKKRFDLPDNITSVQTIDELRMKAELPLKELSRT